MSVSGRGVGERVKNGESRRPESDGKPVGRAGLLKYQRLFRFQEVFDVLFLT
jgi:hypothetical protein